MKFTDIHIVFGSFLTCELMGRTVPLQKRPFQEARFFIAVVSGATFFATRRHRTTVFLTHQYFELNIRK